jgi:hypothetical protein
MGYRSPRIARSSPRNGNLSRKSKAQINRPNPLSVDIEERTLLIPKGLSLELDPKLESIWDSSQSIFYGFASGLSLPLKCPQIHKTLNQR